jgi:hypothetical protein
MAGPAAGIVPRQMAGMPIARARRQLARAAIGLRPARVLASRTIWQRAERGLAPIRPRTRIPHPASRIPPLY